MKIAFCISGQARCFESSYISFQKFFLNHYDCDVFIQTYESKNIDKFIRLYNPKNLLIEKPVIDFQIHPNAHLNKFPESNIENMYWMFRNINKCFNLIEGEYTHVVRARSDLLYEKYIDFKLFKGNNIFIPAGGDYRNGFFDMFAISSFAGMKYYSDLFQYINSYIESGIRAHPETLLKHHLLLGKKYDFSVSRFLYPIKFLRLKNNIEMEINPIFMNHRERIFYFLKSKFEMTYRR